jgi:hypothetical protein
VLFCRNRLRAVTAPASAGDGAGILISMPESFLIKVTAELGIDLPPLKYYGVGMVFLPTDETLRNQVKATMMDVRLSNVPHSIIIIITVACKELSCIFCAWLPAGGRLPRQSVMHTHTMSIPHCEFLSARTLHPPFAQWGVIPQALTVAIELLTNSSYIAHEVILR